MSRAIKRLADSLIQDEKPSYNVLIKLLEEFKAEIKAEIRMGQERVNFPRVII